jgi:hypothetical protein
MSRPRRALALASVAVALVAGSVSAQVAPVRASLLEPRWAVETSARGRAHVAGYLYNRNIQDAANVWLRVERLAADGSVAGISRGRVVGDVISGDRLAFDVAVPDAAATYRGVVESVDWVKECR